MLSIASQKKNITIPITLGQEKLVRSRDITVMTGRRSTQIVIACRNRKLPNLMKLFLISLKRLSCHIVCILMKRYLASLPHQKRRQIRRMI